MQHQSKMTDPLHKMLLAEGEVEIPLEDAPYFYGLREYAENKGLQFHALSTMTRMFGYTIGFTIQDDVMLDAQVDGVYLNVPVQVRNFIYKKRINAFYQDRDGRRFEGLVVDLVRSEQLAYRGGLEDMQEGIQKLDESAQLIAATLVASEQPLREYMQSARDFALRVEKRGFDAAGDVVGYNGFIVNSGVGTAILAAGFFPSDPFEAYAMDHAVSRAVKAESQKLRADWRMIDKGFAIGIEAALESGTQNLASRIGSWDPRALDEYKTMRQAIEKLYAPKAISPSTGHLQ